MSSDLSIQCAVKSECQLGESPLWDSKTKMLYWVDILCNRIYCYDSKQNDTNFWKVEEYVGFLVITKNGRLIAGLKSGLHFINLNKNGIADTLRIDRIDEGNINIRFNDGMMDSKGRIWCCSMDMTGKKRLAKYFCYNQELDKKVIDEGYIIANGPTLNPAQNLLYTVETCGNEDFNKGVYVAEIDVEARLIKSKKKLLIDWIGKSSWPDGIVTDKKGNLWLGEFGGNILRCYFPDGTLKLEIALPAWNVTKIAFRYDTDTTIYVTTARFGTSQDILTEYPLTGCIIEITGIII